MDAIWIFGIVFALSFLVETLTEFLFGELFDKIPAITPLKWTLKYIAVAVSIVGSFLYSIDLLNMLSQIIYDFSSKLTPQTDVHIVLPITWYGKLITGVAIGKGSNYLHQFISQYLPKKS